MKITAIKAQVKRAGRYSVFVDGKYSFSLSASSLLATKLTSGIDISEGEVREYRQLSDEDKIYDACLNYLSIRLRSRWEMEQYLTRKHITPPLFDEILNKLSINGFLNDQKFAEAYVRNRQLLRPTSLRRLKLELRQKRIESVIVEQVLTEEAVEESNALTDIIARKRKQTRYQDDLKLMQYLARQGFSYGDIKAALAIQADEN